MKNARNYRLIFAFCLAFWLVAFCVYRAVST
jgi:hypothetical protein